MSIVSVVIPTFNRGHLIKEAIKSAQNQTYKNIEIIVVDDGSTDDTEAVVNKMAINDHRLIIVKQKNNGVADARNTAIKIAGNCNYDCFLRSPMNIWYPWHIEKSVTVLNKMKDVALVCGRRKIICLNGRKLNKLSEHYGKKFDNILQYATPPILMVFSS